MWARASGQATKRGVLLVSATLLLAALPVQFGGSRLAWAYRHTASPIHYQEYGQETFDRARHEGKPVFMVLSASWCFWCKAYQERTLETEQVAAFLNDNFINVFVDLDQRQDLQHLYVDRGIPTSVVFTPEGEEYISFGGLLDEAQFMSGMRQVLEGLRKQKRPPGHDAVPTVRDVRPWVRQARTEAAHPQNRQPVEAKRARAIRSAFLELVVENHDSEHQGLGQSKKFPQGALLGLLLARPQVLQNDPAGEALTALVKGMLERIHGHLYDAVEGGFFRYASRRDWRSPRHEKMLVTNVNLTAVMALAGENDPEYRLAAGHSLAFLLKQFVSPHGGLYGSLDGKHPRYYQMAAAERKSAAADAVRPQVDPTLFTAWNAEAVVVLAGVYQRQPEPELRRVLVATLDVLSSRLQAPDGGMHDFWARPDSGRPDSGLRGSGQLKANAWAALAFVTGYELTGDAKYLRAFEKTAAYARQRLFIPAEGLFRLWNVPSAQGLRSGEQISEEAPLGANGVLALALLRGHRATGDPGQMAMAEQVLSALSVLEPRQFDEDPNDKEKLYLQEFVYYLRALEELTQLDT